MMETSQCSKRMVKGLHRFTLEKYSLCNSEHSYNNVFTVGGYQWSFTFFPDGTPFGTSMLGDRISVISKGYIGFNITLMSKGCKGVDCMFKITLLDQSGDGKHETAKCGRPILLGTHQTMGVPNFMTRDELEKSSCLKDDCLKIECTISIVLPYETETMNPMSGGIDHQKSCDDVEVGLLTMLDTCKYPDVFFDVSGKKFRAHKLILSSRSPVFESIIASHLLSGQKEIVITGVEPRVFKAVLQFMYTKALPEDDECFAAGYAFGESVSSTFSAKLLAAAHKYDLRSLKLICESHIWNSISLNRFAETISLAEIHNACALKHLCFKYAADNFAALTELGSFTYLEKNYQALSNEIDDYIPKEKQLIKTKELGGWLHLAKEMPLFDMSLPPLS